MSAILFDTLRLSRTLRDKGHFTPEQSEALAEALGEASQDNLATKTDISILKGEIREAVLSLEARIEATKADILKRVVGPIGVQTIVIIGAVIALRGR